MDRDRYLRAIMQWVTRETGREAASTTILPNGSTVLVLDVEGELIKAVDLKSWIRATV
jgi:hypothetical protein